MNHNQVELADHVSGSPVVVEIPDMPMFFKTTDFDPDQPQGWYFSPYEHDHDPKNWSHDSDFPWPINKVLDERQLSVIAAVATEWFEAEFEALYLKHITVKIDALEAYRYGHLEIVVIPNWRKFTFKLPEVKHESNT